jgi:hypothetical protein
METTQGTPNGADHLTTRDSPTTDAVLTPNTNPATTTTSNGTVGEASLLVLAVLAAIALLVRTTNQD